MGAHGTEVALKRLTLLPFFDPSLSGPRTRKHISTILSVGSWNGFGAFGVRMGPHYLANRQPSHAPLAVSRVNSHVRCSDARQKKPAVCGKSRSGHGRYHGFCGVSGVWRCFSPLYNTSEASTMALLVGCEACLGEAGPELCRWHPERRLL